MVSNSNNTSGLETNKVVSGLLTALATSSENSSNTNTGSSNSNIDASSASRAAGREQRVTPALTVFTSATSSPSPIAISTPTKEAQMLQTLREKLLRTPGSVRELHALSFAEQTNINGSINAFGLSGEQPVRVIKNRYVISAQPNHISAAAAAKTPASYRHLIDLTSSNLQCMDVYNGKQYPCKIINEPLDKVQRAYFQLEQDEELCRSTIYGHKLIRDAHDLVPLSKNRTYIINAPVQHVYENLHTYIRHEKRLCEQEARAIFHQIGQTVQVCHRNGIILRDLKLKRFYFIDEARLVCKQLP